MRTIVLTEPPREVVQLNSLSPEENCVIAYKTSGGSVCVLTRLKDHTWGFVYLNTPSITPSFNGLTFYNSIMDAMRGGRDVKYFSSFDDFIKNAQSL